MPIGQIWWKGFFLESNWQCVYNKPNRFFSRISSILINAVDTRQVFAFPAAPGILWPRRVCKLLYQYTSIPYGIYAAECSGCALDAPVLGYVNWAACMHGWSPKDTAFVQAYCNWYWTEILLLEVGYRCDRTLSLSMPENDCLICQSMSPWVHWFITVYGGELVCSHELSLHAACGYVLLKILLFFFCLNHWTSLFYGYFAAF